MSKKRHPALVEETPGLGSPAQAGGQGPAPGIKAILCDFLGLEYQGYETPTFFRDCLASEKNVPRLEAELHACHDKDSPQAERIRKALDSETGIRKSFTILATMYGRRVMEKLAAASDPEL